MSFFISSMPLAVLISSPPVSKTTPFPTSVSFGCRRRSPCQIDETRRARRGLPHRMNEAQTRRDQILAARNGKLGTMASGDITRRLLDLVRPKIARGCVDEIADEIGRLQHGCDALARQSIRQDEARRRALGLLVGCELIGAEPPAQRRRTKLRLGQSVQPIGGAIGQSGRQRAGPERICRIAPGQKAGSAGTIRQRQHAPLLGAKARRLDEIGERRHLRLEPRRKARSGDGIDRNRRRGGRRETGHAAHERSPCSKPADHMGLVFVIASNLKGAKQSSKPQ